MRVARMPWVHWDQQKGRAQYQRRFPSDVAEITGEWFRHKYPGTVSLRTAIELSVEQTLEFNARVDAARKHLATPQAYKEALPENIARDHLIDVRAHFRVAAKNNKYPAGNPATGLFLPGKRKKNRRVDFTPDEINLIVSHARESNDPVIKWSNLIASVTGAGTAEIIDADTRDVEVVDGIPVFHIRTDYRAYGDDDLKNEFRGRTLPVHPALVEGFFAYRDAVRRDYYGGGDGPLFPQVEADHDGVRRLGGQSSSLCLGR